MEFDAKQTPNVSQIRHLRKSRKKITRIIAGQPACQRRKKNCEREKKNAIFQCDLRCTKNRPQQTLKSSYTTTEMALTITAANAV